LRNSLTAGVGVLAASAGCAGVPGRIFERSSECGRGIVSDDDSCTGTGSGTPLPSRVIVGPSSESAASARAAASARSSCSAASITVGS
jgi:hypothetical protein